MSTKASGGTSGIRIGETAINGLVERNVVSGASNALYVGIMSAFTQVIRLNEFTNYSVAIRASNPSTATTDIAGDTGNYWGLQCPGFDPALVRFDNGLVNAHVFDGKPYGQPVARTADADLPPWCE